MAAAGAAGFVLPATARDEEAFPAITLAYPHLLEILRDEQVVCDLGRRYREIVPAENNADALTHAIVSEPHTMPRVPLHARVKEQVQRDFTDGRTVTLNGWVLSVTEARQCALYSLLQS
jgi:hypothetical protein